MDDIRAAIQAAREVIEHYKSNNAGQPSHPMPVISPRVMDTDEAVPAYGIAQSVEDIVGLPIHIKRVSGELGDVLNGYMLRYEDKVTIAYASRLNLCWSRYVMCKELAHVFLGRTSNYTSTSERAIQLLTELFNDAPMVGAKDYMVEIAAFYAATELLLPLEFSPDIREMKELGRSNLEIATSYRVPAKLIAFRYDLPEVAAMFES
jgi:Zn-dependent peptidase ImmA (M78 family)